MKSYYSIILVLVALPVLSSLYYFYPIGAEVDRVFLSISTFLFSIFTGFFISRQAGRFNKVRETVTKFDGLMSGIYRSTGHIDKNLQIESAQIISRHYKTILDSGQWNIHFLKKSTTLTDLHAALEKHVKDESITKLSNQALGAVVKALAAMQDVRKQMVALHKERIPLEQWALILFFAAMLICTASLMPSVGLLFPAILKSAFVISVLSVILILYRLNNLAFTERIMGEESAHDVLNIIDGTR